MIYTNPYRQELAHYGILGMKWGVRRSRSKLSRNAKFLSNEELSTAIRRIELEKRYTQLTTKEKKGAGKWVKEVVANSSKEVAKNYTTKFMTSQVESILKKTAKKTIASVAG